MKKKIFYWSPCLNPVGTVISTLNSAIALSKYNKMYDVSLINACGEWDSYTDQIEKNSVNLINLQFKYFKYLPKTGFIGSRISYIIIFVISFFPLLFLLKKEKPQLIILHLITSLPLTLLNLFNFKTRFMLRISGYPKLNFMRKFFWKKISKKLDLISCPTTDLKSELTKNQIFDKSKIFYLPDAIINYDRFKVSKYKNLSVEKNSDKKIILSVGRLTKQKNFQYLINEFCEFNKEKDGYILYIIGKGEEEKNLKQIISKLNLENKVRLLGYKENVYEYMKNSEIFVLSSLWEEVGFVIVEAAINNLFVISSDCPNGPKEFLNNGNNGLLFNNNLTDGLKKKLIEFCSLSDKKKFDDRVALKKNALKYSKFRHYLKLDQLIKSLLN